MGHHLHRNMLVENNHFRTTHILLDAPSHKPDFIRCNTTAQVYIQERTLFSRSWMLMRSPF